MHELLLQKMAEDGSSMSHHASEILHVDGRVDALFQDAHLPIRWKFLHLHIFDDQRSGHDAGSVG